jgi:hypothetical protein
LSGGTLSKSNRFWTRAIGSGVAYRLSDDEEDEGDTVQQIADLFRMPRTTVYADLSDASKGERPTITATDEPRRRISRLRHPPPPATGLYAMAADDTIFNQRHE